MFFFLTKIDFFLLDEAFSASIAVVGFGFGELDFGLEFIMRGEATSFY